MQPTLQLLEQAEKDIKCAKHYLKQLFKEDPSAIDVYGFPPEYFSPIEDLCTKQQDIDDRKYSETFMRAKIAWEAESYASADKVKAVYPKTPHPGPLKSPQLSSTPCVESEATQSPILVCSPRAIRFEDSVQTRGDVSDSRNTAKVVESRNNTKVSPTEGSQAGPGIVEHSDDVIVSPGLPKDEDLRAGNDDFSKLDDLASDSSMSLHIYHCMWLI